jgi:hypothetical protein
MAFLYNSPENSHEVRRLDFVEPWDIAPNKPVPPKPKPARTIASSDGIVNGTTGIALVEAYGLN